MKQHKPRFPIEEAARRGNEIYEQHIRAKVETIHHGRYVAIDVNTGKYAIGANAVEASKTLRSEERVNDMWFIQIGH